MLVVKNKEYLEQVRKFAFKISLLEQLESKLKYLSEYGNKTRCSLYRDFEANSFQFSMESKNDSGEYYFWFNGGLIFTKGKGWFIHT